MTDYNSPLDIPNQLGQDFVNSGIGGSGGGGLPPSTLTYTLTPAGNQVVLNPSPGSGGLTTQVDIANLPAIAPMIINTANMLTTDNVNTYMKGGISFSRAQVSIAPELSGLINVQTSNVILGTNSNVLTTSGTGSGASLLLNDISIGGTPSSWAVYPANSTIQVPQGTGMNIYEDLNFGTGNIGGYYPDATFYPTNFQVGGGTLLLPNPLTAARNISLYSGVGGTSIASVQGVGIAAGTDVNIEALAPGVGIVALTATADINLLAPIISLEGIVNITGENNTIGNTSVEGGFEVVGITTLNGETIIDGQTNITGLTTITGGLEVSALANLNGGLAVEGAVGIVGQTSLTGNLTQVGGGITTTGSLSAPLITTSSITNAGTLSIAPSGNMALVNLSSINGQPYIPGTNTPWYNIPAGGNVSMNGYNLYGLNRLSGFPNANLLIDAYNSAGSTCSIVIDATTGGRIIMSGGAVEIDNKLNVNGDVFVGSPGTHNTITADKGNFTALSSISSINGLPYATGNVAEWSLYPADHPVVINSEPINGVSALNVALGQNFSINNAFTATYIQGNSLIELYTSPGGAIDLRPGVGGNVAIQNNCPLSVYAITGVSSINGAVYPPPNSGAWYNIPAQASPSLNNYSLANVGSVLGQVGGNLGINDSISGSVAIGCALTSSITTTGSNVNTTSFNSISLLSQTSNINLTAPRFINITGNGGVNIQSDIGVNVNTSLKVLGNLNASTITGVSSITGNGNILIDSLLSTLIIGGRTPNIIVGDPFKFNLSTFIYGQFLGTFGISSFYSGIDTTLNGTNSLTLSSATTLVNGNLRVSSIVGVSTINGVAYPPEDTWYNTPAGANVNMNNYSLTNANNVFSPGGDTSFIVGGGNQTSYIRFNDSGNTDYEINPGAPTMYIKTTTNNEKDFIIVDTTLLFLSTGITTITGQTQTTDLFVSNDFNNNGTATMNEINGDSLTINTFNGITNVKSNTLGSPMWVITYAGSPNADVNDQGINNSASYIPFGIVNQTTPYTTYKNQKAQLSLDNILLTNPFGSVNYMNGFKVPYSGAWRLSMNLGNTYLSWQMGGLDSGRNNVLLLTNMDSQVVLGSIADSPTWYTQTNPIAGFQPFNPNSGNTISQVYILTANVNYGWYFCNQHTWGNVTYTRLSYANTTGTERNLTFAQPYYTFEYCG